MNAPAARPPGRYGEPLVSRRTARVLLAVLGAVFLIGVVVVGTRLSGEPVKGDLLTYEHVDEGVLAVDVAVTMTPGTAATCSIQALNESRAQVGFIEAVIPAQDQRRSVHHLEISTQGLAVAAELVRCDPA